MAEYQIVLVAFLVFFVADFLIERVLAVLNARHVDAHRVLPDALKGKVPEEAFQKSIPYTLARLRFGHVAAVYSALLTLFLLFSGVLPILTVPGGFFTDDDVLIGALGFFLFGITLSLLTLPLQLYSTFVIEARYGFNRTTLGTFILDRIKGLMLLGVLGIPFFYALVWLMVRGGPYWWLWAACFVVTVQLVMMVIGPLLIAPLFNRFTPLPEGELKDSIRALADTCGFALGGMYVVDGSRRSSHSNAYFTGLGRARRVVLYDTLVKQLSVPELTAVVAHEIGHYKRKHIPKFLAVSIAGTFLSFYALSFLLNWHPLYQAFSAGPPIAEIGLLLLWLSSGSFFFWLGPLMNAWSRKHEYEADAYAAQHTAAEPMGGALLKLYTENLGNVWPHPWYSAWHYSHPALLERLKALGQA